VANASVWSITQACLRRATCIQRSIKRLVTYQYVITYEQCQQNHM